MSIHASPFSRRHRRNMAPYVGYGIMPCRIRCEIALNSQSGFCAVTHGAARYNTAPQRIRCEVIDYFPIILRSLRIFENWASVRPSQFPIDSYSFPLSMAINRPTSVNFSSASEIRYFQSGSWRSVRGEEPDKSTGPIFTPVARETVRRRSRSRAYLLTTSPNRGGRRQLVQIPEG